jgi:hypothetical protein
MAHQGKTGTRLARTSNGISTYTPKQTSFKASFRASGQEQENDQELAGGFSDERWNDEDHFTNKSGDPRIGTHHRT